MIQNVLQHLGGIERYGVLSIAIFFTCFLATLVWACNLKKPFLNHMAAKPLEPDSPEPQTDDASRHE
jgi:hypothetical protein